MSSVGYGLGATRVSRASVAFGLAASQIVHVSAVASSRSDERWRRMLQPAQRWSLAPVFVDDVCHSRPMEDLARTAVRVSSDRRQVDEWATVLAAGGISHRLRSRLDGWALIVAARDADAARETLDAYDRENSVDTTSVRRATVASVPAAAGSWSKGGYWLIGKVRALPPERGGTTPAAALTGFTGPEHRASVLRAGFQYHIEKPVTLHDLAEIVALLALKAQSLPHSVNQGFHRSTAPNSAGTAAEVLVRRTARLPPTRPRPPW